MNRVGKRYLSSFATLHANVPRVTPEFVAVLDECGREFADAKAKRRAKAVKRKQKVSALLGLKRGWWNDA